MTFTKAFIFLFALISYSSFAQTETSYSSWNTLNIRYDVLEKFHVTTEFHFRRTNFLSDWSQFIIRPSINFEKSENVHYALGYSSVKNYRETLDFHENNLWEQVSLLHRANTVRFNHRFRLEQRFIEQVILNEPENYEIGDTNFVMRFRYRITMTIPLINFAESPLNFILFDEIWLNTEKSIVPKSLNQNWFYLGLSKNLCPNISLSIGYMDFYAPIGIERYSNDNILQTSLNIKLGRKVMDVSTQSKS